MQSGMHNRVLQVEAQVEASTEVVAEVLAREITVEIEEADLIVVVEEGEVQEVVTLATLVVAPVISVEIVRERMRLVAIVVRSVTSNLPISTRRIRLPECSARISRHVSEILPCRGIANGDGIITEYKV